MGAGRMARPVIGIITNFHCVGEDYPVHAAGLMLSEAAAQAAGGLPLLIPADPRYVSPEELMEAVDGVLFTGGRPNVHPEEYGEEPTEKHGAFDRCRDGLTLPLIRAMVARGQPLFGICRGFQEVNVAFGGTLHPELGEVPGRMNHRMVPNVTLEERFGPRHKVRLAEGGVFHHLLGATEVMTNTLHGQGIKAAGARIRVEGWAEDGTEEALHVADAPGFTLSVQWHPEFNAVKDPVSHRLFSAFGRAASAWAEGRRPVPVTLTA